MCLLMLFQGMGEVGGPLELHVPLWGIFVGKFKWSDHQKNFFISNSVEALIPLKEGQVLLMELHVHLGGVVFQKTAKIHFLCIQLIN